MSLIKFLPEDNNKQLDANFLEKSLSQEKQIKRLKKTFVPEWFPQSVIQLTWPHKNTDWAEMIDEVENCYLKITYEIASRQPLIIVAPNTEEINLLLAKKMPNKVLQNIQLVKCDTNDTWARDHGFLSVIGTDGAELLDFKFNGWGGKFNAILDNAINQTLYQNNILQGHYVNCLDFELEGGSIETNGLGDLLTTTTCLLNPNRGSNRTKEEVTIYLQKQFNIVNVLWLKHGFLEGDDTDAHIDTLARMCPDNSIIYVKCYNEEDNHFIELQKMEEELKGFQNTTGQHFKLIPVPLPNPIYNDGERLPATYANYLVLNKAVLVPTYNQYENDTIALQQIAKVFTDKEIIGIDCTSLIKQHGSLHCATMQYPKGTYHKKSQS